MEIQQCVHSYEYQKQNIPIFNNNIYFYNPYFQNNIPIICIMIPVQYSVTQIPYQKLEETLDKTFSKPTFSWNDSESFILYNQIFPGEFRIFANLLQERVNAEKNINQGKIICKIISSLYNVVVRDCRMYIYTSQNNLYKFKVKNLHHALIEILRSSNSLEHMIDKFKSEYNLSCDLSSENDQDIYLPSILSKFLNKLGIRYNWDNTGSLNQLKAWCATICNSIDKNIIIKEISKFEKSNNNITPFSILNYLMDTFI
jgi:hypothetical protein